MHLDLALHHTKGVVGISVCATWSSSVLCLCRCTIMRGGMEQYLTPMGPTKLHVNPIFEISPLEPQFSEWLVFEGLSIDEFGRQHYLDASVAYKRAVLNCIHYLAKFGYTKQQASFMQSAQIGFDAHRKMQMFACCPNALSLFGKDTFVWPRSASN